MRICIFSRTFHPAIGGLERIAQILAFQFVRAGHQIEVVTDTLDATVNEHLPFAVTRTSSFWSRVSAFRRADVVLFMNVSLHGLPAAAFAGTPVVLSHHVIYGGKGIIGRILEWIKRQACQYYANISVSEFVARHIPAESVIVPNAFDEALFKSASLHPKTRDFVFCGRLVSDKGADVFMYAFSKVVKAIPDATLTVVGDGPERQTLQALVAELQIADSVHFTGVLIGVSLVQALQQHICMVVPSRSEEPFGIVALEGIACCDTVIVTKRGGLPQAVGSCGLVVEPSVDGLSAAMVRVAQARRAGALLPGQPSKEVREGHLAVHSPTTIAARYLSVLRRAAKNQVRDLV